MIVSRRRRLATIAWSVVAACWVLQFFVPSTARGPMSATSPFDTARFAASGLMSQTVPTWLAAVLLVVPVTGVVIALTLLVPGRSAWVTVACALVGTVAALAIVAALVSVGGRGLGPGAWLAGTGLVLAAVATAATHRTSSSLAEEIR